MRRINFTMKQKITLLITGCIISVAALACIQGYFMYNTYKLYAKEADHTIRQELLALETTGKLDSLNKVWMDKTTFFIAQYNEGMVSRADFKKLIAATSDSLSAVSENFIQKNGFFQDYDVAYNNYLTSVVVYGEYNVPDTLFNGSMLLYGSTKDHSNEIPASQSNWHGTTADAGCKGNVRDFEVVSRRTYSIANWQKQVMGKMAGMLVFTILLLAFVVALFYLSIKNLIAQKKIADVKTDFINNITHEFQTPIAAMDIAVKTLQHKEVTQDQFSNTLTIIGRQNHRMQKLFSQVTQASLSPGQMPVQPEALDCADIKEIVHDFMLSQPAVAISCPDVSETRIYIDRFHLATLLLNLLDNAVKYGGTKINIVLAKDGPNANLSVSDNGMGIPQKEKTAIFDKFYRVQKGNIHNTKGLGLGLYYVNQIIQAYNGNVTVTGQEGNGSTFTISIPLP